MDKTHVRSFRASSKNYTTKNRQLHSRYLSTISDTDKEDTNYLSISENNYIDFDEQIVGLKDVQVFKKWKLP